jgi:hypothetical protein
VSIETAQHLVLDEVGDLHFQSAGPSRGLFSIRISHTARTWGADIEGMLTAQLQTLLRPIPRWKLWIGKHSAHIALAVGLGVAAAALGATFLSSQRFATVQEQKLRAALASGATEIAQLQERIGYILEAVVAGEWPRHLFYAGVFLGLSFILAIVFGVWAGAAADNPEPSFLLLSRESEKARDVTLRKLQRGWIKCGVSLVVSVLCSVVGNVVFVFFQG